MYRYHRIKYDSICKTVQALLDSGKYDHVKGIKPVEDFDKTH